MLIDRLQARRLCSSVRQVCARPSPLILDTRQNKDLGLPAAAGQRTELRHARHKRRDGRRTVLIQWWGRVDQSLDSDLYNLLHQLAHRLHCRQATNRCQDSVDKVPLVAASQQWIGQGVLFVIMQTATD